MPYVVPLYVYVFVGVAVVSVVFAASSYLKVLRLRRHRQWRDYLIDAMSEPLNNVPRVVSEARDESGERYTTILSSGTLYTDLLILGMRAEGHFAALRVYVAQGTLVHTLVNVKDRTLDVEGRILPLFLPAGSKVYVTLEGVGAFDLLGYEVPSTIRSLVRDLVTGLSEHLNPAEVTHNRTLS